MMLSTAATRLVDALHHQIIAIRQTIVIIAARTRLALVR